MYSGLLPNTVENLATHFCKQPTQLWPCFWAPFLACLLASAFCLLPGCFFDARHSSVTTMVPRTLYLLQTRSARALSTAGTDLLKNLRPWAGTPSSHRDGPLSSLTPRASAGRVPPVVTADEALAMLKSDQRVFIHSAAAFPQHLVDAMVARATGSFEPTHT